MRKESSEKTNAMERKWFCQKLREFREGQRMSQEELARKAHLHRTYVSQLENGKKMPSLTTICHLALALQVEPWQLLYDCELERES